jgi:hypothetical protein
MYAVRRAELPSQPPPARATERRRASVLVPTFRVEVRPRHDEHAPVAVLEIAARTAASARHTTRRTHPDSVIVSITRV